MAWLVAELTDRSRRVRCTLGILAILGGFGVAWLVVLANRWNCDVWYGGATRALLGGVLEKLEAGQADLVKQELRTLLAYPSPGYANRVRFNEWANASVARLKTSPKFMAVAARQGDLQPQPGVLYGVEGEWLYAPAARYSGPANRWAVAAWRLANEFAFRTALRSTLELPAQSVVESGDNDCREVTFIRKNGGGNLKLRVDSQQGIVSLESR
ncbi:MAG: hypothetical protein WC708_20600 [Lentisphaeria bacterium]